MTLIYKILSRAEWDVAKVTGEFAGSAVDLADGYIHFSAADQAQETAAKWFAGQPDLMLLSIETEPLGAALKWEPSRGGALFPHLYRPLRVSEVLSERALMLDPQGVPDLGVLS